MPPALRLMRNATVAGADTGFAIVPLRCGYGRDQLRSLALAEVACVG